MHNPIQISSLQNPQIKKLVNLRESKWRKQLEQFLIEGAREQEKALQNSYEVCEVYVCPELLSDVGQKLLYSLQKSSAIFYELTVPCFEKITVRKGSDGILLLMKYRERALKEFKAEKNNFLLMIEGVEKPGNLGALLRTADGAGVQAVFVIGKQTDLFNPNVIRSSLGTCFSLPVFMCTREEAYSLCKAHHISIYAAVLSNASVFYNTVNYAKSCAILLGSEDKGLDDFWVSHASQLVSIPMHGQVDSLNVSAAGAVLLYEASKHKQD